MKQIATGNTAEVFDYEEGKILKLFKAGYPRDDIEREFRNAVLVNSLGIPSPKTYAILPDVLEGRTGIVYEKITGHDLLQEVLGNIQDSAYVTERLVSLATLHKEFIRHRSTDCISYKDYLSFFGYPDVQSLPDGDFLCHGDFHFANLLRSAENPDSIYIIDFMNLCHGPKEYDIARAFVLLTEDNLGPDMPGEVREALMQAKRASGEMYLQLMGCSMKDIAQFIPAIEFCRKKEML